MSKPEPVLPRELLDLPEDNNKAGLADIISHHRASITFATLAASFEVLPPMLGDQPNALATFGTLLCTLISCGFLRAEFNLSKIVNEYIGLIGQGKVDDDFLKRAAAADVFRLEYILKAARKKGLLGEYTEKIKDLDLEKVNRIQGEIDQELKILKPFLMVFRNFMTKELQRIS